MSNDKPYTDPQLDGHERFRVSKENFGVSNDTRKIILENLNNLQDMDTTSGEWDDEWYPDYPYSNYQINNK